MKEQLNGRVTAFKVINGKKKCNTCFEEKAITEFQLIFKGKKKEHYKGRCKKCYSIKRGQYKNILKRKYGMSHEEYLEMIKNQNNKCAICKKEFTSLVRKKCFRYSA